MSMALLIPGLPNEISVRCLARVSRAEHCRMKGVCRSWRDLIAHGESPLYQERSRIGFMQTSLLCLTIKPWQGGPVAEITATEIFLDTGETAAGSYGFVELCSPSETSHAKQKSCWYATLWTKQNPSSVALLGRWRNHQNERQPFYVLDILRRRARRGPTMTNPTVVYSYGAADTGAGGLYVFSCGNGNGNGNHVVTQRYDFRSNTWTAVPPCQANRAGERRSWKSWEWDDPRLRGNRHVQAVVGLRLSRGHKLDVVRKVNRMWLRESNDGGDGKSPAETVSCHECGGGHRIWSSCVVGLADDNVAVVFEAIGKGFEVCSVDVDRGVFWVSVPTGAMAVLPVAVNL